MWRRHQTNSALPVPTYYPDDGADSHSHSPRRRSYVAQSVAHSGVPMPNISSTLATPSAVTPNPNTFHPNLQTLQKTSTSCGFSFMDPFNEAAYQEWINSLGLNQQQPSLDVTAIWPNATDRNSAKQSSTDPSMSSMSDYLSCTMGHTIAPNSMSLSGTSLDDDTHMSNPKVPTNTPTTLPGGDPPASSELSYENFALFRMPHFGSICD